MGVSRVDFDGETLVDLTGDTVDKYRLLKGVTSHNAAGEQIIGELESFGVEVIKSERLENVTIPPYSDFGIKVDITPGNWLIFATGTFVGSSAFIFTLCKQDDMDNFDYRVDSMSPTLFVKAKENMTFVCHNFLSSSAIAYNGVQIIAVNFTSIGGIDLSEYLKKQNLVKHLLATEEGNPLDATMGKELKDLHDANAEEISKLNGKLVNYLTFKDVNTVSHLINGLNWIDFAIPQVNGYVPKLFLYAGNGTNAAITNYARNAIILASTATKASIPIYNNQNELSSVSFHGVIIYIKEL